MRGEDYAVRWLDERGVRTIERNVRYSCGEIDIIAVDDETIVFIEVKTRSTLEFGGAEAVIAAKLNRMRQCAARWLEGKPVLAVRFDVMELLPKESGEGEFEVHYYEAVDDGAW